MQETTVAEIAEHVRGEKTCLLIGAGVSVSAGVGLAAHFVRRIEVDYPSIYSRLCGNGATGRSPSYADCMAALTDSNRAKLVREEIAKAKINSAHVGIARLERSELLNAVLTTNFDPLVSRGCAMFNRFPAIYDLAGLRDQENQRIHFDGSYLEGSAIFHLHGQHTGFELLNTEEKLLAQAKRIRPVLDAVMRGKPVIIAGYSGENDPLVDQIMELAPFNHGLFWVCHDANDPTANVCQKLLSRQDCYLVRNMPADRFFPDLANAMQCPSPQFLVNPFQHMLSVIDTLTSAENTGGVEGELIRQAQSQLKQADQSNQATQKQTNISEMMASGQFKTVWEQHGGTPQQLASDDQNLVALAAIELANANALLAKARTKQGEAADALFDSAGEKYAAALAIKPDDHEALLNWSTALLTQAGKSRGKKRGMLLDQAEEKLLRAEDLMPGKGSYNLACVYGLRGDATQAADWLKKSKDADINCPDCAHIAADTDFKLVRDAPEFVQALADIGC